MLRHHTRGGRAYSFPLSIRVVLWIAFVSILLVAGWQSDEVRRIIYVGISLIAVLACVGCTVAKYERQVRHLAVRCEALEKAIRLERAARAHQLSQREDLRDF